MIGKNFHQQNFELNIKVDLKPFLNYVFFKRDMLTRLHKHSVVQSMFTKKKIKSIHHVIAFCTCKDVEQCYNIFCMRSGKICYFSRYATTTTTKYKTFAMFLLINIQNLYCVANIIKIYTYVALCRGASQVSIKIKKKKISI